MDPLSRRALWKTLLSIKHDRSIVCTTHFLDEADLLADQIAILAAPGKLVAKGDPVTLKRTMGRGYTVHITPAIEPFRESVRSDILNAMKITAPEANELSASTEHAHYHLQSKETSIVQEILEMLERRKAEFGIGSYDVVGTTIEDIFLRLMNDAAADVPKSDADAPSEDEEKVLPHNSVSVTPSTIPISAAKLKVSVGRNRSFFDQAIVIFYKRWLIMRRSWLTPVLAILVGVLGSCIPLFYLSDRPQTCTPKFRNLTSYSLYLPSSRLSTIDLTPSAEIFEFPPNIIETLGKTTTFFRTVNINDSDTFVQQIQQNIHNLSIGGLSLDINSGMSIIAYESSPPGINGPAMLNLASNILYNQELNKTGTSLSPNLIVASYGPFPPISAGTLLALRWIGFFGLAMVVLHHGRYENRLTYDI